MKHFSIEQLKRMHEMLCAMTGNEPSIREIGLLESALYSVEQTFMGEPLYKTELERGARLCFCLIKNHAFVDAIYDNISMSKKEYAKERHIGDEVITDIAEWINSTARK